MTGESGDSEDEVVKVRMVTTRLLGLDCQIQATTAGDNPTGTDK